MRCDHEHRRVCCEPAPCPCDGAGGEEEVGGGGGEGGEGDPGGQEEDAASARPAVGAEGDQGGGEQAWVSRRLLEWGNFNSAYNSDLLKKFQLVR